MQATIPTSTSDKCQTCGFRSARLRTRIGKNGVTYQWYEKRCASCETKHRRHNGPDEGFWFRVRGRIMAHNTRARSFGGTCATYSSTELKAKLGEPCACYICQSAITRDTAELDHVEPLEKRGPNTLDNIAWSCHTCNTDKANHYLSVFLAMKSNSQGVA